MTLATDIAHYQEVFPNPNPAVPEVPESDGALSAARTIWKTLRSAPILVICRPNSLRPSTIIAAIPRATIWERWNPDKPGCV
jgi:hypothetical protein